VPNYKYRALSADGTKVSGVIDAYDEFEAVDKIKQSYNIVEYIKVLDSKKIGLNMTIGVSKIKEKALALMCSQFSIVLRAGLPIVRCVELIAEQTSDRELNKLLKLVAEDVATGYGLAQSFENKGGKRLPTTLIETVRSGEESGTLELSFAKLSTYFDNSAKTKGKVKSAMMYPAFLGVLAVAVIIIILTVAMPVFTGMLENSGQKTPVPTQILMDVAAFFGENWQVVLAVLAVIIVFMRVWSKSDGGRMMLAKLLLKIPILGKVSLMKGASQFANTMSTMLASGLTIVRAVGLCAKVLDNYHLATELGKCVSGLEEGRSLGFCLKESAVFPNLLVEMTTVGEETGTLETTLDTIGVYYDAETALASQAALSALQPAITVVMGIVIGFIVIALYLPMFNMYG